MSRNWILSNPFPHPFFWPGGRTKSASPCPRFSYQFPRVIPGLHLSPTCLAAKQGPPARRPLEGLTPRVPFLTELPGRVWRCQVHFRQVLGTFTICINTSQIRIWIKSLDPVFLRFALPMIDRYVNNSDFIFGEFRRYFSINLFGAWVQIPLQSPLKKVYN